MAGQLVAGGQGGVSGHSGWGRCTARRCDSPQSSRSRSSRRPWLSSWCAP